MENISSMRTRSHVERKLTNKDESEGHSQQGEQAMADGDKCGEIVEVARSSSLNLGILRDASNTRVSQRKGFAHTSFTQVKKWCEAEDAKTRSSENCRHHRRSNKASLLPHEKHV
jgi:hypothetical protein